MIISKKLITLWSICIILIATALYSKYSNETQKPIPRIPIEYKEETVSSDFYQNENEPSSDSNKPKTTPEVAKSPISAKSFLVGNVETGEIYMYRNMNTVLPVASMSKLITAIASIDQYSLSGTTTITEANLDRPDSVKYTAGEVFTVEEALEPLLISSSNIMAEALASTSNRTKFMELMSSYAWEIGMPSTFFADPSGISPLNISSANDFFALAKYLYKLRPDILKITKIDKINIATTTSHGYHEIVSTHPFISYPGYLGGKTGRTPQAKDTMLSILEINGQPIAIIVLGSENRKADSDYLIKETQKILSQI